MRYHVSPGSKTAEDTDARQFTLTTAVRDAAAGRLSDREIAEALHVARLGRPEFNALVAEERTRLDAEHDARDRDDAARRQKLANVKPLNDLGGGWDRG
jgi:hypothetical protein